MKNRRYILLACLIFQALAVAQTEPSFISAEIVEARPSKPNIAELLDTTQEVHSNILYTFLNTFSTEQNPTSQPLHAVNYGIFSGGKKEFNKFSTEGYFSYTNSQLKNIDWQLRTPLSIKSVLTLADSIGGDWNINSLKLMAKIKAKTGVIQPYISLHHAISHAAKAIDPRPLNKIIQIQIEGGATWQISDSKRLDGSIDYTYEKEDVNVIHLGNKQESLFYRFMGQKSITIPEISNSVNYRFLIDNVGGIVCFKQQVKQQSFTVECKFHQQFNKSIFGPYNFIITSNSQVERNAITDISETYLFRDLSMNYDIVTAKKIKSCVYGSIQWNNGKAFNEKENQTELTTSISHLYLYYQGYWLSSNNNVKVSIEQSKISTKTLLLSDENYNFTTLTLSGNYHLALNKKYSFTFSPTIIGEYHNNDYLTYNNKSPFIITEDYISTHISKRNFNYYSANKYMAALKLEITKSQKRNQLFTNFLGSYSNICNNNSIQHNFAFSLGMRF